MRPRRLLPALAGVALLAAAAVLAANAGALSRGLTGALPAPITTLANGTVIRTANMLQAGDPAPDFTLTSLDGTRVRLSDYAAQGRPVLVNFWASWCVPCKEEMPDLQRAYASGKLAVLGVNATDLDSEPDARRFVAELGLTFPILLDSNGNAQRAYAVRGLPFSVLVGADGRVASVHVGQMSPEQIQELQQP